MSTLIYCLSGEISNDAVIAALQQQLDAAAVFSFDRWSRKIGLTVIDDLIVQSKEAT